MKKRSLAILVVIAVLVVGLGYLAAFGATFGYYDILSIDRAISQGLELAGGTCAVYQVKTGETSENLKEDLQKEQMMIAERLSGMGYSDATVVTQGENQIRIELPEMIDTAKILNTVTKKAQLQFIDEADKVWLTGEHVERAFAGYYNDTNIVYLEFTAEGTELFAEATEANIGKTIRIVMDGEELQAPQVTDPITTGTCSISGEFSEAETEQLATLIRLGEMPLALRQVESYSISSTLGEGALAAVAIAAAAAFVVAAVVMIVRYRASGVIAVLGMAVYALVYVLLLSAIPSVRMGMSGIAGLLVSMILALVCIVWLQERFRAELCIGKDQKAALSDTFRKLWPALVDVCVIVLVIGLVSLLLASGTLRNFGFTLTLGAVLAALMGLFGMRWLMQLLLDLGVKSTALLGKEKA